LHLKPKDRTISVCVRVFRTRVDVQRRVGQRRIQLTALEPALLAWELAEAPLEEAPDARDERVDEAPEATEDAEEPTPEADDSALETIPLAADEADEASLAAEEAAEPADPVALPAAPPKPKIVVEPTVEVMTLEPEVISETIAEVVMAEDDPAPAPVSVAVDVPVAEVTRVVSVVVATSPRRCQTRNQTMELSCFFTRSSC
jgi:hypothetical protein